VNRQLLVTAVGVVGLIVAVLTGCGTDGTTLPAPKPGATTPPLTTSTTSASDNGEGVISVMQLSSPSFVQRGEIPVDYTCKGENVSPPLQWAGVPTGAKELAITVTDADANGFVHWVIAGLPPSLTAFGRGAVPEGSVQTKNDAGTVGWTGPCQPAGPAHHYTFTLYALDGPSGVTDTTSPHAAIDMIGQVPGQAATLIGVVRP
jgi:Raf kinase inhibitor-like YbhB/YbcL family protein